MTLSEGKRKRMESVANRAGVVAAAAMDQRGSLFSAIAKARGVSKDKVRPQDLIEFKIAVTKILTPHASAILLDPEYALPALK
jgi:tagatose 1,6-diphosphate aldolase